MTDTPNAEVEAIVRLWRDLGLSITALEEQRAGLRARFDALVPVGFSVEVDGKPASKSAPNRAFDERTAVAVATAAGITIKKVERVDTTDLRNRLEAIGRLDAAMVPGTGSPIVRLG